MNVGEYLKRINFKGSPSATLDTLFGIHERHIFSVPFENLSIHCEEPVSLHIENLFRKVVGENRGGYCYELNFLFYELLIRIGYSCTIVSSRIYNTDGSWGPDFDHLSLTVLCDDRKWLLDVGYGDLFLTPIEIAENKVQTDGRNYFKIVSAENPNGYILLMSGDNVSFEIRYRFNLSGCAIDDFSAINQSKQVHPDSYFVKNLICTKPTQEGRVTLLNNKLILKTGALKREEIIESNAHLRLVLKQHFGIQPAKELSYPLLTR